MDFAHASLQIDTCNIKQTSECSTPQDAQVRREGGKTGRVDGEEDDLSGTEEHLSEYFLAIQKVLHDIAAKLTHTHHLTFHNALAAGPAKRLRIEYDSEEEENEDRHDPEGDVISSE